MAKLTLFFLCLFYIVCEGSRNKRTLVYPPGVAKVQSIMGAGFPVDLDDETVIVGIVIKSHYFLPQNASFYTNPNVVFARRRKRSLGATRWDIYKILEHFSGLYGYGGKGCILRTICELSDSPIDKSTGIIEEILHVLFTPTTTGETLTSHPDNEYYAAQKIGKKIKGNCHKTFPDCKASFVDMFTASSEI